MKFCGTTTCDECPWLQGTLPGRFPPERFAALRRTAEQGFDKPIFACHKTRKGEEQACVGFLLAAIYKRFNFAELRATGPLYGSYAEMERANRPRKSKKKRA